LKKKDDEINELKKKIEEMSAEFAKMLKVLFFVFIVRKLWIKCKKGSNLFSGITILILK